MFLIGLMVNGYMILIILLVAATSKLKLVLLCIDLLFNFIIVHLMETAVHCRKTRDFLLIFKTKQQNH